MPHIAHTPPDTTLLHPRYRDMVNSNGTLFHLMPAVEISVAQAIVRWLDRYPAWGSSLKAIPLIGRLPLTDAQWFPNLHFLWNEMEAAAWLHPDDANGPHSLLWGVAVLRVAYFLNTGSYALPLDTPQSAQVTLS